MQVKYAAGELERLRLPVDLQPGGECVKVFFGNLAQSTTEVSKIDIAGRGGLIGAYCWLRAKLFSDASVVDAVYHTVVIMLS